MVGVIGEEQMGVYTRCPVCGGRLQPHFFLGEVDKNRKVGVYPSGTMMPWVDRSSKEFHYAARRCLDTFDICESCKTAVT